MAAFNSVLLISSIDAVGIARLPEIFHRAGYKVSVLTRRGTTILSSRFTCSSRAVTGGPPEVAAYLATHVQELARQYDCLIPCDEPLLEAIAARTDAAEIAAEMPFLPPPEMLQELLSKVAFLPRARAAGIPLPEFVTCRSAAEAASTADRFGFPVVVKTARSMAGSGVHLGDSPGELLKHIRELPDTEFLVQRYMEGQVGATPILMDRGIPIRYFSFYKQYNWPTPFAPSTGGQIIESPQIFPMLRKIGEITRFHGLCSIDWLEESATGRIFLLEFNPRYTAGTYRSAWAGSDFVSGLAGIHARKTPAPPVAPHGRAGQTFRMFPEAAFRAIDDLNPWLLARSLGSAPWHDPKLLLAQIRRLAGHYVPASWKQPLRTATGARAKSLVPSRNG